jgi:competence protein ComEC
MNRTHSDALREQVVIDSPIPQSPSVMNPSARAEPASPAGPESRKRLLGESGYVPHRQPFVYLTAALIIGILLQRWIEPPHWIAWSFAVISCALSMGFVIGNKRQAGVALLLSCAMAGALLSLQDQTISASRLKRLFDAHTITSDLPVELEGVLSTPPEPAPQIYYLNVEAERVRIGDRVIDASGFARLMISLVDQQAAGEFNALGLDYGSRVRVLVRLERARVYHNPGSPDFNEFLERHGYDLKGTIKSPLLVRRIGRVAVNPVLAFLHTTRLRLIKAIDSRFKQPVAGTLKAMLAGNQYFLDQETIERLRQASTFHTLVISGMHIALIAWALVGLGNLWGLRRSSPGRRQVPLVFFSILVLWGYAVMVGLAAPVTRGAAMISVGLIGPMLFRRAASINTVMLAAFAMLALKPSLVADPGFQLSFVAVAGIVTLALPIAGKLRGVGEWRPTARAPHPPSCSAAVRWIAETLFWNQRRFEAEMRVAPVRYRMNKARAARLAGRFRLQPLLRGIALLVITSTAIQLTMLPLMAMYFNRAAPVGVLLNIVAGLLTGVLMLSGLAAIVAGTISVWVAAKLGLIVTAAHYLLVNSVVPFITFPGATFRVAHYEGWQSVVYALYFVPLAMLAVLIDLWRPVDHCLPIDRDVKHVPRRVRWKAKPAGPVRRRVFALLCFLLLAVSSIAVVRPAPDASTGRLAIHFLDVGQGDSALVVFPRGATMLVDGGGELRFNRAESDGEDTETEFTEGGFSVGEAVASRFIWSLGRTRVDYVLATHADADHIDGVSDVVRNFHVGQAIVGRVPESNREFKLFFKAVEERSVSLATVNAGDRFEVDGVSVEVLWPPRPSEAPVTSGNNDSVVLRLVYGSIAVLLTGDIEQAAENALIESGVNLRAEVLKVPHHGSKTSSSGAFINAVQPGYAVISVGERSRFGHPHPSVVNRYEERGVSLFQTGRDGTVTVETDGHTVGVTTFRKKRAP